MARPSTASSKDRAMTMSRRCLVALADSGARTRRSATNPAPVFGTTLPESNMQGSETAPWGEELRRLVCLEKPWKDQRKIVNTGERGFELLFCGQKADPGRNFRDVGESHGRVSGGQEGYGSSERRRE